MPSIGCRGLPRTFLASSAAGLSGLLARPPVPGEPVFRRLLGFQSCALLAPFLGLVVAYWFPKLLKSSIPTANCRTRSADNSPNTFWASPNSLSAFTPRGDCFQRTASSIHWDGYLLAPLSCQSPI